MAGDLTNADLDCRCKMISWLSRPLIISTDVIKITFKSSPRRKSQETIVDCPTVKTYSTAMFHDKYERTPQGNLLPLSSSRVRTLSQGASRIRAMILIRWKDNFDPKAGYSRWHKLWQSHRHNVVHSVVQDRLWQIQAVSKSTLIAYLSSQPLLLLLLLEIQ